MTRSKDWWAARLFGVCPANRGQAYNGLADSAGPWE